MARSQLLLITVAMTTVMITRLMLVHPHLRFGIGAIPIRGIILRYPNARFHGDKLFSNQRGMPLDYPLRCQAVYLLAPRATVVSTHRI